MGLRNNMSWKLLIGTLGLSLAGCGGAASEGENNSPTSAAQELNGVTLTLNGGPELTLECGLSTWVDPGATATGANGSPIPVQTYNSGNDEYGPGPDPDVEGDYSIFYFAQDAAWNQASATRTVHVKDRTAPTLTLTGPSTVNIPCYGNYDDPKGTSSDACYGDLTDQVLVSGEVQNWVAGSYTLTYTVTDSRGNAATPVTRTVNVVDCPVW